MNEDEAKQLVRAALMEARVHLVRAMIEACAMDASEDDIDNMHALIHRVDEALAGDIQMRRRQDG